MQPTPIPKSAFRRSLSLALPLGLAATFLLAPAVSARAQGDRRVAQPPDRGSMGPGAGAMRDDRQLGLAAALADFFRSANLVDQTLSVAEQRAADMRRSGVIVSPLPEVGQLASQIRMMQLVRTYLRAQQTVSGVAINTVDLPLPAQELVGALAPQNAIYLNSFALERMRTLSDAPQFPDALRALLKTTRLIHEPPPPKEPTETPPGGAPPDSPGAAFQGLVNSLFGVAAPTGPGAPAGATRPAAPAGPPPVFGPGR